MRIGLTGDGDDLDGGVGREAAEPGEDGPGYLDPPVAGLGHRFEILGEIARGGMGVILRGRDPEFDREVAVKVLQERYRDRPEMARRFVEEARIAGRLQHPGLVPIFERGTFADGLPYYAMKLVRGRTLADLFAERPDPAHDRDRLLDVFLKVAQTAAYAHSRGIIHRDLTPANVMVGEYGEVQVMDWGLARLLPRDEPTGEEASADAVPGESPHTVAAMGTPGYMAPEQVGGEPRRDERVDVFALGSILCEILSGRPAFHGSTPRETQDNARRADLSETLARLGSCGADEELMGLVRDCLDTVPERRPRHAGEVADRLSVYLDGVSERLRLAELARVEAQARAAEERKRRRLNALLAVLAVALVALAVSSYAAWSQQRQAARASAALVLRDVEVLRDEAAADPRGDPARWRTAEAAVRRAKRLLADEPRAARDRLEALAGEVGRALRRAEADRRLVDRLEFAHARADEGAFREADALIEAAFREAGLELAPGDPAEFGRAVASRPRDVAQALVLALDCWAIIRREREANLRERGVGPWRAPLDAARAADPDPWRNRLRDILATRDQEALARLAQADDLERRPAASLWLLGRLLVWDHQTERAQAMLARAWRVYPDDYWINLDLSLFLTFPPAKPDLAFLYNTTTVALRPGSAIAHMRRGLLIREEDLDAAEAEFREALRIWPECAYAHLSLADLLAARDRWEEAADAYRAAIRLSPESYPGARLKLADALIRLGEPAEGSPEPATRPERFEHWYGLGVVRLRRGDGDGAAEALRRAAASAEPGTPGARDVAESQAQVATRERLRAILRGEIRALDNDERLQLIRHCDVYDWAAGAARLYAEMLEADPDMPRIRGGSPFLHAARYAARAGTGPTGDDPPPDDAAKARLRRQALAWMRAEFDAWTPQLAIDKPETRRRAVMYSRRYREDPALARLRDPKVLQALPEDERKGWEAFWGEVAARIEADPN